MIGGEMVVLIISIALGVLVGTLIVAPHKFVPVAADANWSRIKRV